METTVGFELIVGGRIRVVVANTSDGECVSLSFERYATQPTSVTLTPIEAESIALELSRYAKNVSQRYCLKCTHWPEEPCHHTLIGRDHENFCNCDGFVAGGDNPNA